MRALRSLLRGAGRGSTPSPGAPQEPFDPAQLNRIEQALRDLPAEHEGARQYLAKHIPRLARTLALVPAPGGSGRVLELGCYMQITALLDRVCGYREVRGAYYGPPGKIARKTVPFPDRDFHCEIDHFDAERDPYPYPDEHFDLVIAGEIFEHMVYDPMHLLLESRRVLREGGSLLVSTPNSAGLACVYKALEGKYSPQIYPHYKIPDGEPEIGHMREYTLWELGEAVKAAGFELDRLFATVIEEYQAEWRNPLMTLLESHGYNTENRGEQSWCVARKRSALPVDRYPKFIYGP
ncbi:MAG: class I SAM-dependent methyltransferase [Acidobacteriota bacterium]|nr:class I SAM-dependent methyltransferase [Acidobacteriota bacterium]